MDGQATKILSLLEQVSGSSVANVTPVNCKVERSSPVRPSPILVCYIVLLLPLQNLGHCQTYMNGLVIYAIVDHVWPVFC